MNTHEWILHIDGDGFFAYCEIARFPHLKGKPVVVGEERGIVCASTYEAKRLGITRAMPIFKVREQFPQVIILPCHFELYEQYATKLAAMLKPEVDVLERYSIDECFGVISFPRDASKGDLHAWLRVLKVKIQAATGLTYSFGLARTKVLAKVASKRQKPDGCTVLMSDDEEEVLAETPIESIWGIGWKLTRRLQNMRVKSAADFTAWSEERVAAFFSQPVQELWHELHGRRMFSVAESRDLPKSLQSTRSFTPTSGDKTYVLAELLHNTDVGFARLREYDMVSDTVSIFLRTKDRQYHSTVVKLERCTSNLLDVSEEIHRAAAQLFVPGTIYRSTGITLWNLRPRDAVQHDLFGAQATVEAKGSVMAAVDTIRARYGQGSIGVLSVMPSAVDRAGKRELRSKTERYEYGLPLPYLGEVS